MHRFFGIGLVAALLVAGSFAATGVQADEERPAWVAVLSGSQEVPAVDTRARGQAFFQLSDDMETIRFRLVVANIVDVMMSHIHLGPAGANGGIVVWLYPSAAPAVLIPGRSDGILAEGVIDAGDLVNALAGKPISDLLAAFNSGGAYVNVHTTAHGGGEIRGQVYPAS